MASAVRDYGELALPLAWCGLRRRGGNPPAAARAAARRRPVPAAAVVPAPWTPSLARDEFAAAITRIAGFIAAGDTYQVNYTFALEREGASPMDSGRPRRLRVDALCIAHEAGYGARLDIGDFVVLSASPELFVERRGNRLEARPMKGTSPRGRWLEEDRARRDTALVKSEKARAENVMIVRPPAQRSRPAGRDRVGARAGAVHGGALPRPCGSDLDDSRRSCRPRPRSASSIP